MCNCSSCLGNVVLCQKLIDTKIQYPEKSQNQNPKSDPVSRKPEPKSKVRSSIQKSQNRPVRNWIRILRKTKTKIQYRSTSSFLGTSLWKTNSPKSLESPFIILNPEEPSSPLKTTVRLKKTVNLSPSSNPMKTLKDSSCLLLFQKNSRGWVIVWSNWCMCKCPRGIFFMGDKGLFPSLFFSTHPFLHPSPFPVFAILHPWHFIRTS